MYKLTLETFFDDDTTVFLAIPAGSSYILPWKLFDMELLEAFGDISQNKWAHKGKKHRNLIDMGQNEQSCPEK